VLAATIEPAVEETTVEPDEIQVEEEEEPVTEDLPAVAAPPPSPPPQAAVPAAPLRASAPPVARLEAGRAEARRRADRLGRRECELRGFADDRMVECVAWALTPVPREARPTGIGTIAGVPDITLTSERARAWAEGYEEIKGTAGDEPGTRRFRSPAGWEIALRVVVAGTEAPLPRAVEDAIVAGAKGAAICYERSVEANGAANAVVAAGFVVDRTGHAAFEALITDEVELAVRGFSYCVMGALRGADLGPPRASPSERLTVRWSFSPGKWRR
jgi:hypothetical protein